MVMADAKIRTKRRITLDNEEVDGGRIAREIDEAAVESAVGREGRAVDNPP